MIVSEYLLCLGFNATAKPTTDRGLAHRRLRASFRPSTPDLVRKELWEPPRPQDALKPYLAREVMGAVQARLFNTAQYLSLVDRVL